MSLLNNNQGNRNPGDLPFVCTFKNGQYYEFFCNIVYPGGNYVNGCWITFFLCSLQFIKGKNAEVVRRITRLLLFHLNNANPSTEAFCDCVK